MEIVSFVILHYKDWKVTDWCVKSILRMNDSQQRIRIVIVDNDIGETAEKRQQSAVCYEEDSRISVLCIKENGGFSYANNIGYQYARETQNASYIIVLNNDIEFVQEDFLEHLDKSFRQYRCHVLAPDILHRETGEHQNPMDTRIRTMEEAQFTIRSNRLALRFYPVLYPFLYWKLKRDEKVNLQKKTQDEAFYCNVQENIVPFGACLIFTPEFVRQEEKAFAPETRFFYEEYILTCRCQKKGYRIVYVPSMTAIHESGGATKKSYGSEKKRIRFMMERTAEACGVYKDYIKTDIDI